MIVYIERKIRKIHYEEEEVLGSVLYKTQIPCYLWNLIKSEEMAYRYQDKDPVSSHLSKQFKKEVGFDIEEVAAIAVEDDWYEAIYFNGNIYLQGFYKGDIDGRVYDEVGAEIIDELEAKAAEGPYDGAFESWEDYYNHRGLEANSDTRY